MAVVPPPLEKMPSSGDDVATSGSVADFTTSAEKRPDTQERPLAPGIAFKINKPGVARACLAVSTDRPEGDQAYAAKHAGYTTLQQHVMYFDTDNDGEIWVSDTYRGFRDLGFAIPFCLFCSPIIHAAFSYGTKMAKSHWPDPFFRIYIDGIHKAKACRIHSCKARLGHGYLPRYDNEGRFRPQQFEEIFSKYDKDGDGGLTRSELQQMRKCNRVAADVHTLADGRVWKEDLRGIYEVSLMWRVRERRKVDPESQNDWGFGKDDYFTTYFGTPKSKL